MVTAEYLDEARYLFVTSTFLLPEGIDTTNDEKSERHSKLGGASIFLDTFGPTYKSPGYSDHHVAD